MRREFFYNLDLNFMILDENNLNAAAKQWD